MMKIQNRKMNGSDRKSSQVHWNSSEWNQVSTWVMDGCASRPKADEADADKAQALYLKPLTGHLFLCVERRARLCRAGVDQGGDRQQQGDEAGDLHGARLPDRSQAASGFLDLGRPPSSMRAAASIRLSKLAKLRCAGLAVDAVAQEDQLPRVGGRERALSG
jgi:hypothetical protein